ncbi:transcriptional regulator with XRE-family HTH domain [Clostridium algifaecis]|uniref:Transcriptional regulator with XRE-family HTH domain n=1 Tax=Clostridium algifaecis TaxID=1472040 RepID=A0ABS4KXG9_9CLOT|nr:XRE family transcriptional regulator [Clostridium algifaecis]MBP2033594.1 transcriptional regulator with XRE-family HTH domain [Clostridium algifaecis]
MENINKIVAYNLKKIREDQGLSFDKMSQITGVSKGMLCQIEKAESNPSINTLYKISNTLKISLSSLISQSKMDTIVVDKNSLMPVSTADNSFRIYTMFPFADNRNFEIFYGELEPDGSSNSEPHQIGTQEYLTVFTGELLVKVENKKYLISSGQSIGFKADVPHSYQSYNNTKVIFCNTIFYSK